MSAFAASLCVAAVTDVLSCTFDASPGAGGSISLAGFVTVIFEDATFLLGSGLATDFPTGPLELDRAGILVLALDSRPVALIDGLVVFDEARFGVTATGAPDLFGVLVFKVEGRGAGEADALRSVAKVDDARVCEEVLLTGAPVLVD